jgi:hypothetical protein
MCQERSASINPALLNTVWPAQWIAYAGADPKAYGVFHFRKELFLPAKLGTYVVHVSGDNRYELYVNGNRVCFGPARGDVGHWRYETVDLAPFLKSGSNVLAAVVWNQGEHQAWAQISHRTGFLMQGNTAAEAGVNTDTSWQVMESLAFTPVATIAHITGPQEHIFAQRYLWGWQHENFDASRWPAAVTTEKAVPSAATAESKRRLVARTVPLLEEKKQRFASIRKISGLEQNEAFIKGNGNLEVHPWANVTILLDQAQLTTAFPELIVSGGKGARITITYAEALAKEGRDKGNRNEFEGKVISGDHDVFLPDGGDKRHFRPLWYRTFRFVELRIENHQEHLSVNDFFSTFTAYPFKENAVFKSSDPSLEKIWEVGWRTARLCAYETYMDCPYYEQLQYVGDTRIQALISLYVSGDDRLMRNAIDQFRNSFTPDGLTRSRYPDHLRQIIPPFSLFWIGMLHDYWRHRPDTAFVRNYLSGIKQVLDWHAKHIDENNMLTKVPHWNFVDWPDEWPWKGSDEVSGVPAGTLEGHSSILTLQYVYALNRAADLFDAFGQKEEAAQQRQTAARLKESTLRLCWDAVRNLLADTPEKKEFSQHANVMAVLVDLFPAGTGKELMQRVALDTSLIQCTYYYRFYLNQAMKKAGLGEQYVAMLQPWRQMLDLGLTTFAERQEPTRSDCHAWSASPNYDLLATVAGIEPASPGFKTIRIAPHLGSLQWVDGKMPHPSGEIRFSLKRNGTGGLNGEITLPKGLQGTFEWQGKTIPLKGGGQKIRL